MGRQRRKRATVMRDGASRLHRKTRLNGRRHRGEDGVAGGSMAMRGEGTRPTSEAGQRRELPNLSFGVDIEGIG